jgi:hypothetical protein
MTYRYEEVNGFKLIDGVVYHYECARCVQTRNAGHWTQEFVDKFHKGNLADLNIAHKRSNVPYSYLHEVKRIEQVATSA